MILIRTMSLFLSRYFGSLVIHYSQLNLVYVRKKNVSAWLSIGNIFRTCSSNFNIIDVMKTLYAPHVFLRQAIKRMKVTKQMEETLMDCLCVYPEDYKYSLAKFYALPGATFSKCQPQQQAVPVGRKQWKMHYYLKLFYLTFKN